MRLKNIDLRHGQRVLALAALVLTMTDLPAWGAEPPAALTPEGWRLHTAVRGDLNKDGRDDWALTLSRGEDEALQALFVVAFAREGGKEPTFEKVIESKTAVCFYCGGLKAAPGVPVGEPTINNGVLTLGYFGGSRETWNIKMKWRWAKNHFELIGLTSSFFDTVEPDPKPGYVLQTDVNVSTGQAHKLVVAAKGKTKTLNCRAHPSYKTLDLGKFDFATFNDPGVTDCAP